MLNRRAFLCGTICTAVASPLAAGANQAGKAAKIGSSSLDLARPRG